MKIPGIKAVRKTSGWLQDRIFGGALIIGYHRIAYPNGDESDIAVTPAHFSEQMEIVRKYAQPIRLTDLVEHLIQGTMPHRSVAITFDDGYADNLIHARPLLDQYQIPASIFISTDFLGREFWWDELERLILFSPSLPRALQLNLRGGLFTWRSNELDAKRRDSEDRVDRRKLINSLYHRLKLLEIQEQRDVIHRIQHWSGNWMPTAIAHRALSAVELKQLADERLIDIGSHTCTHPILTKLPAGQQLDEIHRSKALLEELIEKPVSGFAYPNGIFTKDIQAMVMAAGYTFACSSRQELTRRRWQRYSLPRFWPKDWDGDRFERSFRQWMGK